MKLFIFIISIAIMSSSFGQSSDYKKMLSKYYNDFPTISIDNALTHVKKGDALFLDVRRKDEFLVSHIKSAKRMNLDGSNISDIKNVDKDKLIIVYCSVGARSQNFGEILQKKGYTNVKNIYGGLFYWANEKYPMVDLKENKTARIHGYNAEWGKWVKGEVVY
ncbi:MAG TPA: rhodanese-like domain-containing protein [Crocinitomicaceae bacterium]|nr:rhodanese-like domain-containing protein [Crocinitomicaceae bacterium]